LGASFHWLFLLSHPSPDGHGVGAFLRPERWHEEHSSPGEIAPKRDAHHILTLGYVKILLWLECSLLCQSGVKEGCVSRVSALAKHTRAGG
jgi:hypothetical protein